MRICDEDDIGAAYHKMGVLFICPPKYLIATSETKAIQFYIKSVKNENLIEEEEEFLDGLRFHRCQLDGIIDFRVLDKNPI